MTTAAFLPSWLVVSFAVVLGGLVGWFLDVVVWRVPRGVSITKPGGADSERRPRVSMRRLLLALGTAASFVLVALGAYGGVYPAVVVPLLLYWAAVSIALALIDLEHFRLPNAIVFPSYVVTVVALVIASILTGEWGRLLQATAGFAGLGVFFLALAVSSPRGMGFGDVKLAGALGSWLGWLGWPQLLVGAFTAFIGGGIFGAVLLIARRATRTSRIPFGPFMLLGAWIGVFAGPALVGFSLSPTAVGGAP
ncbi:prepilin peptidase [Microbacterium sp.]|uniref:prepilin peptidase n=1 Tax=Microbacterium sp. TaxID=51671 RepID=UPI003C752D23